MIDAMLENARSLAVLMEEETGQLARTGRCPDHAETVTAKRRLVAQLEAEITRLNREAPDWARQLGDEERDGLQEAMATLRDAALSNARVVERQLALSNDMIDAVAAEAKRLTGNGGSSYRQSGAIARREGASPISINTRL